MKKIKKRKNRHQYSVPMDFASLINILILITFNFILIYFLLYYGLRFMFII
jgi:hypothetical protein